MLAAGIVTAILSNLREDSIPYMRFICHMLKTLTRKMQHASYAPYAKEVACFIFSHLNTYADRRIRFTICVIFKEIVKSNAKDIGLNCEICASLIRWADTARLDELCKIIEAVTHIILATSEYTELFIECGLLSKLQTLLESSNYIDASVICACLNAISKEASNIVDKAVQSDVISQIIPLIRARGYSYLKKNVIKVLGNVCANCSFTLIPQLLDMNIAKNLTQALFDYEPNATKEYTAGLRGIIRYCREISNPELFKSYVNAEELAEKCRELVSTGVTEASDLLRDVLWVMSGDKEAEMPTKKHKSSP